MFGIYPFSADSFSSLGEIDVSVSVSSISATASINSVEIVIYTIKVNGVSSNIYIGDALVNGYSVLTLDGLLASLALNAVSITTTSFDFESVKELYSRARTAYVERKSTSLERTIIVDELPRVVFVGRKSTSADRSSYIDSRN